MSQVFPNVYAFPINQFSPDAVQNVILVATKNPDVIYSKDDIRQKQQQQEQQGQRRRTRP
jgi:hypothetical protein